MEAFGNEHDIDLESSMKDQLGPEKISGSQNNARAGLVYYFLQAMRGHHSLPHHEHTFRSRIGKTQAIVMIQACAPTS